MFLLLEQKFHGFVKIKLGEKPVNGMSSSTPVSLSAFINGVSYSSVKSKTISSKSKPFDWFLAFGF